MAQYDVYRGRRASELILDCQTDAMTHYETRLVVPLIPPSLAPKPATWLNPTFRIEGRDYVMVTQFAATIPVRDFGALVRSLAGERHVVARALDFLLTGV